MSGSASPDHGPETGKTAPGKRTARAKPTAPQAAWLMRGLDQPGGKLPLFDGVGRKVNRRIIEGCIENGWAEHWFFNPIKPDWIVCKLTPLGREMAEQAARQDTASESSSDTGSPSRSAPC